MKRTVLSGAILALALTATAPQPAAAEQRVSGEQIGAALAAIVAIGVGVAIAKHHQKKKKKDDWDEAAYGQPFSPSPDVVCLPQPRQCFEHSHFSARWTHRIFGG